MNGLGSLTITSPAGHGIVSKDDLVITGGAYSITSASHGLDANDSIRITGETSITIDAGKDGVHAENDEDPSLGFVYISNGTMNIEAEGDGMSAGAYMQIENGTFKSLRAAAAKTAQKSPPISGVVSAAAWDLVSLWNRRIRPATAAPA